VVGTLLMIAGLGTMPVPALVILLVVLGFASAVVPILIAHGKSLFPPHLVGRGITLLNMGTMGGVFLSQLVSGAVIEMFPAEGSVYPLDAYRLVFGLQGLFLLAACIAYLGARDPRHAAPMREETGPPSA
jgi:MFS family permease